MDLKKILKSSKKKYAYFASFLAFKDIENNHDIYNSKDCMKMFVNA